MSFPEKIHAFTIAKTGDFDVLEKTEVPFPKQGPSDLIIKISHVGVNFIDTYYR
jgi:NADPH:quinone reductase